MNVSMTRQAFFAFVAVLVMVLAASVPAFAQSGGDAGTAGRNLLDTLQGAITGNLGLFIGLFIVILGLWTWIIKQETGAGITMIIGGVLITLAPGLFNGAREFVGQALNTVSGNNNLEVEGAR